MQRLVTLSALLLATAAHAAPKQETLSVTGLAQPAEIRIDRWGIAHIYFLIGTRSRFAVAWSWLWIFVSGQHSARLITQKETLKEENGR